MPGERAAWLGIELRHLAALDAVAAEGSFRRAGARLGYGQSAISQQIAALERTVGQRLIERGAGGRGLQITTAGEVVLRHASAIVARLQAAEAEVAAAESNGRAELRVGVTESVATRLLPSILHRFEPRSSVRISPTVLLSDLALYEAVARAALDVAVVELPAPPGPFATHPLLDDPYVLLLPSSADAAAGPASLDEIGELALVRHSELRGVSRIEERLRTLGREPRIVASSSVNAVVQALVAAGLGGAVLPSLAVDVDPPVVVRSVTDVAPCTIAVVRNTERVASAAEAAFTDAATAVCSDALARRGDHEPASR